MQFVLQIIIREEFPKIFDALAMLCEQGTDRAKQVRASSNNLSAIFNVIFCQYSCLAIAMLCADEQNQLMLSQTEGLLEALVDLSLDESLSDSCRANVAWAIGSISNENPAARRAIGDIVGAFAGLVMIACTQSDEARERAAFAIAEVSRDCPENQVGFGRTDGTLEALVHLCATGSESGKEQVAILSPATLCRSLARLTPGAQAAWAIAMLVEGCEDNVGVVVSTPYALEVLRALRREEPRGRGLRSGRRSRASGPRPAPDACRADRAPCARRRPACLTQTALAQGGKARADATGLRQWSRAGGGGGGAAREGVGVGGLQALVEICEGGSETARGNAVFALAELARVRRAAPPYMRRRPSRKYPHRKHRRRKHRRRRRRRRGARPPRERVRPHQRRGWGARPSARRR